jgi:hypothetical protein
MGMERLYMPWGGEGTKSSTDQKEGFYGGPELKSQDDYPLKGMPTVHMDRISFQMKMCPS